MGFSNVLLTPQNSTFPNDVGFASAVAGNVILTSDPSTSGVVGDDEGTVFRFEFHPGTRTITYEQSFKAPGLAVWSVCD